ncbi:MAG TPA: D-2-hydroxyacid dehydrogenase [Herpetosiphonaceae bacterium]
MQIIVTSGVAEQVRARVVELDLPVELIVVGDDGVTDSDLSQAVALFRANLSQAGYQRILEHATSLRWMHTASAGVENLLSDAIRERGISFTNSAGVHAIPIAEWVLHALLTIVKRGPRMLAAQHEHRWERDVEFDELGGKTLTILGAGGIGQEIARRAAGFGMRIWGVNRSGREVSGFERIVSGEQWRDLLPETDFLVIATPLTAATKHLVGAHELEALPDHAWLINIARGAIVDEPALVVALQNGTIAGAALDTFEQEPLPAESPLWTLPNVLISPHNSGSSPRSTDRVVDLFIENLKRFVADEPLRNVVDLEAGY